MSSMMRYALRGVLYIVVFLLLTLVGIGIFAQTGLGKRFLASTLSSTLSSPESGIEISRIDGWLPIDMQIDNLKLTDQDGLWLEVSDIALDWSPSALFGGRLQIDRFAAAKVNVLRPPVSSEESEPPPPSDEPFRLPELPDSLPPVTLETLRVDTIELGDAVLGEAASFSLDGSLTAADDGRHADLTLDLQRLDEATAFATLTSTVSLDPQRLSINLDAGETGRLLEQLSGRSDAGDLDLSLTGDGPLNDWTGRLNLAAGGFGTLGADLSLALVEEPRLGITAALKPADTILPANVDELIGEGVNLLLQVTQNRAQAITLDKLEVGANAFGLKSAGVVDFERGDIDLKTAIDAPDLGVFSKLAGADLAGEAGLTLDVAGTLTEPMGALDLRARSLGFDGIEVADVTTTVDWQALAPLDTADAGLRLTAEGGLQGLSVPDTPLPDDEIAWGAAVDLPFEGAIDIERASVGMAGADLSASGKFDPQTLISDLDIGLAVDSLQQLAAPYGQAVDGKASMNLAVETTEQAGNVKADLGLALTQLANLPDGAKELVGEQLDLDAAITLDQQRYLKVSDLLLAAANVSLQGSTDLDLESQVVSANLKAALPKLAVLASTIGQPIEGAIGLDATIDGTLEAPIATLAVKGDKVVIADEAIEALSLKVNGRELLAAPEGDLRLDLTARKTPLALAVNYRLEENVLSLPKIDLDGPKTALDGQVELDLDTLLAKGSMKGRQSNLAALQPLLEQSLSGTVDFDLSLDKKNSRQDARLSIGGKNLGGDFGGIETVDLSATLQDLLGKPRVSAKTDLKGFEQETASLDTLTLKVDGGLDRLAIALDLDGEVMQPLSLSTEAELSLEDALGVAISRLNGSFANEELALNRPMRFQQKGNSIQLEDLDFRLGSARLTGDVDIGERDVAGRIDLSALSLALLERFDGPEMKGLASLDLDLGGTVSQPTLKAALNLDDVQTSEDAAGDLPPIDVVLDTNLQKGQLTSRLSASGLTDKPINAELTNPLVLKLQPFAFEIPEDGALDGEVQALIALARLGDLLALDGQDLDGSLSADLTIGGRVSAPRVIGPVTIKDGAYDNVFAGTAVRDIEMAAQATNERFSIDQLTASMAEGGTIKANGFVGLDPEANFPLSLSVTLDNAEVVNRDDVEAVLAGTISMLGNLSDAEIRGKLEVRRAEIQIPEGGGPSLPDIDIEEVGGNIINAEKTEEEEAEGPPFDPDLDMSIALPNKVYVRGRGLESEWEGNLQITGPTSDPRITGQLAVKKGYFDFLEKRFELEKGVIDFSGGSPPNPIISVIAAATDDDFKAIINVDGPATDPKLRLSSEPELPEDEVLARLLFNRELSEIGAVEAAKLALALNKLRGGGGGFDAFGEIRNALNIDTLDIVGGEDAADSKVKAGKYLSDDVYFEVERGAADESGRAKVEIEVLPNISIEADTGEDASGGVGLKWRFDY